MHKHEQLTETLAALVEATGNYRCLRRLALDDMPLIDEATFMDQIIAIVDTETTGLDPRNDTIIELAIRLIAISPEGRIVGVGQPMAWLEDPGMPLAPEIIRLTGLTDADLAGRHIVDDVAAAAFEQAKLIVSHNARFDRPFLENRLAIASHRAWACSLNDINWRQHGFEGRSLSHLLGQCGLFSSNASHRAGADVDMLIGVLGHVLPNGRTVAFELIEASRRPSYRIDAVGTNYNVKDTLKSRGYRWNPFTRVWWREVAEADRDAELDWLEINVYAADAEPRCPEPIVHALTAATRHRS
jgi:DNA polymerase-3 subunit epsilon